MPNTIQVKRGLEANRSSVTPAAGEFLYTTDQKKVYIGDGTTAGGVAVNPTITQQVELISTANASGAATVDFTNLSSTYSEYFIVTNGLFTSLSDLFYIRTSSNNGSSFDAAANNYSYSTLTTSGTTVATQTLQSTQILINTATAATVNQNDLFLRIVNAGSARPAVIEGIYSNYITTASTNRFVGYRASTTAVNAIRILCATGGVTITGTFKLYGVRA